MIYQWRPDRSSRIPVHIQMSNYLRSLIHSGTLRTHTKIPSQRCLMQLFEVSRTTTIAALNQLLSEGLLISHPKSGLEVADIKGEQFTPDWSTYFRRSRFRAGIEEYKHWSDRGGVFDFALSRDFDSTPYFKEAVINAAKRMGTLDPDTVTKYGLESLRESVAEQLKTAGIRVNANNVLIVPSAMLAIYVFYSALMGSGSNFLYEKANLITTITNVHSIGMHMVGVEMDRWGISDEALAQSLARHKCSVLHIDPTDHAPTGIVMSKKRIASIMKLVRSYRVPVVEIAHLRDVWREKPYPPALKSMQGGENVIYIGSFVRSFPFDLRVAWMVGDQRMVEHLSDIVIQMDLRVSLLLQLVADEIFRSGRYEALMQGIRDFVCQRREVALQMCSHYLKDSAHWNPKHCLFHFWLQLNNVNTRVLFEKKHFDTFAPGYFFDRTDTDHILLCPASLTESTLEESIKQIARLSQLSQSK